MSVFPLLFFRLPFSWVLLCGSKALNKDYFSTVAITRVLWMPWGRITWKYVASLSVSQPSPILSCTGRPTAIF